MPTDVQSVLAANAKYVRSYADKNPSSNPKQRLAIVTCMDAWIHEADAFGIELGDAHIIRNAGGSAREALRSLIVSQQVLGTNEVWVVKHTRCGMDGATNGGIHDLVKKNHGRSVAHIDFLPFQGLERAVREDVEWLKAHELMSNGVAVKILGWIIRLETGCLIPVV